MTTESTQEDGKQIIELLGSGTQGNVFIVGDNSIQKYVAKQFKKISYFWQEVQIYKKLLPLKSKLFPKMVNFEQSIVRTQKMINTQQTDIFQSMFPMCFEGNNELTQIEKQNRPTLYLELAPGMELCDFFMHKQNCNKCQPFSKQLSVHIFKQLILALHQLKRVGIAHLDIKLSNIILLSSADIKLIDFGISKNAVDQNGEQLQLKSECSGTSSYLPPQVFNGATYRFGQCDLYAAFAVLYRLFVNDSFPSTKDALYKKFIHKNNLYWQNVQNNKNIKIDTDFRILINKNLGANQNQRNSLSKIYDNLFKKKKNETLKWLQKIKPITEEQLKSQIILHLKCMSLNKQTKKKMEKVYEKSTIEEINQMQEIEHFHDNKFLLRAQAKNE